MGRDAPRTAWGLDESVSRLHESVRELQSDTKQLRLEWEETYESVNRALRKLAKREQRAEKDCGCGEKNGADPEGGSVPSMALARQRYGDPWRMGR